MIEEQSEMFEDVLTPKDHEIRHLKKYIRSLENQVMSKDALLQIQQMEIDDLRKEIINP